MKRGESELSLVAGVDKPLGITSHDVVNRCRRIFNERRVGHMGTLDPLATGVLIIGVGPATRLGTYLCADKKRYEVKIIFGEGTDTDDAEGTVIKSAPVPDEVFDPFFAQSFVQSLVGVTQQIPPAYSAIKVEGKKAYNEARKGHDLELKPREIEIYSADLVGISGAVGSDVVSWDLNLYVSKGAYIRALARDIGEALDCPAHVGFLRRTQVGSLEINDCVSLDVLEHMGVKACIDPIKLLKMHFAYVDGDLERLAKNGNVIQGKLLNLFEMQSDGNEYELHDDQSIVYESDTLAYDGEPIALIAQNKLTAIYEYVQKDDIYKAHCVFSVGVSRGLHL